MTFGLDLLRKPMHGKLRKFLFTLKDYSITLSQRSRLHFLSSNHNISNSSLQSTRPSSQSGLRKCKRDLLDCDGDHLDCERYPLKCERKAIPFMIFRSLRAKSNFLSYFVTKIKLIYLFK